MNLLCYHTYSYKTFLNLNVTTVYRNAKTEFLTLTTEFLMENFTYCSVIILTVIYGFLPNSQNSD